MAEPADPAGPADRAGRDDDAERASSAGAGADPTRGPGSDRAARLLAAVLADPDSDAARLVYADELVLREDPRGDLIHADIALAGPLSIRKRALLRAHRAALIERHAAAWWPRPMHRLRYRVRRGFVESVAFTRAELRDAAGWLFTAEPVIEVRVTDAGAVGGGAELAGAAWMPRVRRLIAHGVDDDDFTALVTAPACQGLRSLNVAGGALSAEVLASLADHLPACRTLVLTGCELGDDGVASLAAWSHLAAVETLYLSNCDLGPGGIRALVARPLLSLSRLVLTGNPLDDTVAAILADHAHHLPALRHLELQRTGLSADVLDVFAASQLSLERLDLRRNHIAADRAAALPFVRAGDR